MGVLDNINKQAPRWFRKLQRATSIVSDTIIVFLLALGMGEDSFWMLVARIGLTNLMKIIEAIIIDDEPKTENT
jgi:hypothetical protein